MQGPRLGCIFISYINIINIFIYEKDKVNEVKRNR